MVIYKFENKINGKVYIGQTIQKLSKRISSHKYPSGNKNLPIDAAIKKYGIENFSITTIDHANSVEELNEKLKVHLAWSNRKPMRNPWREKSAGASERKAGRSLKALAKVASRTHLTIRPSRNL